MMRQPRPVVLGIALAMASAPFTLPTAQAGGTIKIDDTKWVSVGAGLRTSYTSEEDAAPSGSDRSNDFELDSVRLYINGQIHENILVTFNTERDSDGNIELLDGIAQFEFSDLFNDWMGRFLPPSDRSNLDGPYYLNTWNFPSVQAYPAICAGRDDGAAIWGQVDGGMFKYQAGLFEGENDAAGPNQEDELLFAGRAVINFWDPEPGYYNSSTYYGGKEILALGLVYQSQSDASGTAADPGDFAGWSVDGLLETKLAGGGVATGEFAYYDYDHDDKATAFGYQGDGYFVLGSYLFPQKVGIGQLQPMVRFQKLDDDSGDETDITEVGVNYIIDGHNARISFVYGEQEDDPAIGADTDTNFFQVGVQLQI